LTVRASHDLSHIVKETILERLDWVEDVLVHVEPFSETPGVTAGAGR
jgi:divalent metal cation (Fe/Co/Zn/Cd) transporter